MANRIQLRRDTTANWANVNPILSDGEMGYDIVTNEIRIGDGSTAWTGLSGNVIGGGGGGGGGASTGDVTFSGINIIGDDNLRLQPNVSATDGYVDIYLTGGPDIHIDSSGGNLILGPDNWANIRLATDGNVQIRAQDGISTSTWTFNPDGVLTLPASTSNVMIDASTVGTQTIAQNGTVTFPSFSGEILVNAIDNGSMYKYLVGGSKVWILGSTSPSWTPSSSAPTEYAEIAGQANIAFNGSSYVFTNLSSSNTHFNIVAIKTRNNA
jgi:hypothetical protein